MYVCITASHVSTVVLISSLQQFLLYHFTCALLYENNVHRAVGTFKYVLQQAGNGMTSPWTTPWHVAMVTLNIARQHQQLFQLTGTQRFRHGNHRPRYASQPSSHLQHRQHSVSK